MVKLLTNFSHKKDNDLSALAQHVIASMTGNAAFPTPVPALSDVSAAADAYDTALAAMGTGGKAVTIVKNQNRKLLEGLLTRLARYTEDNCNNDPAVAATSGFESAKERTPVGPLAMPLNLSATADKSGEIVLHVQRVAHALSYLWQYKSDADTDWHNEPSGHADVIIKGLQGGVRYTFRVTAVGTDPSVTWSNPVSLYAQ